METKDILRKVDMLNIDPRFSLIVASYFCAKVKSGEITEETIDDEISKFKQRVKHFEFIKSSKFKVAYEESIGIITVNKDFLNQTDSDEIVPLIFMKIEEALNTPRDNQGRPEHNKDVLLHIKSFQKAVQLLKELNLPCNDNYNDIYNILTEAFGADGNALAAEISTDRGIKIMCIDADEQFNKTVARGETDSDVISQIINLYRYRVLTDKENGIDVTSETYRSGLQKVMQSTQNLHNSNYANIDQSQGHIAKVAQMIGILENPLNQNQTISAKIEKEAEETHNDKLFESITERFTKKPDELTPEYIQERVSRLIQEKPNYDKRLSGLLQEFFQRSSIIYGWSKDDFEQRINSIDSTIQKIGFKDMDTYTGGDTASDKIKLNAKFFLDLKGKINNEKDSLFNLARIFFHEAGHNTDKSIREGMTLQKRLASGYCNNIFYEWSNTVFERAIMGEVYTDDNAMFLNKKSGYGTMANAGSMISAALGMNEIEFARLKDAGLEQTIEFFDKNFSYYPGLYEKLKTTFMVPSLRTEGRRAKDMVQKMYKNLYALCLEILDARIENDTQSGKIENPDEYQEMQRYLLKKMNINYQTASKKYGHRMDARKVCHQTRYTTDRINKKAMRRIGTKIRSESDFGFENDGLLTKLKNSDRKPTLRERLKRKFGKVELLEAGRPNDSYFKGLDSQQQETKKGEGDDEINK